MIQLRYPMRYGTWRFKYGSSPYNRQRPKSGTKSSKSLKSFLFVIHSHLYSFALKFLFLQTHATSYSLCKGERRKTWQKITRYHPFLWFMKSIQKPQKSLRTLKKPSTKLYVHEFAFRSRRAPCTTETYRYKVRYFTFHVHKRTYGIWKYLYKTFPF